MILKKLKPSKHLPVWPGLLSALILELKQIPIVKKNPPFSFLVYVNSADYKKIQGVRSKARKKKNYWKYIYRKVQEHKWIEEN